MTWKAGKSIVKHSDCGIVCTLPSLFSVCKKLYTVWSIWNTANRQYWLLPEERSESVFVTFTLGGEEVLLESSSETGWDYSCNSWWTPGNPPATVSCEILEASQAWFSLPFTAYLQCQKSYLRIVLERVRLTNIFLGCMCHISDSFTWAREFPYPVLVTNDPQWWISDCIIAAGV